MCNMSELQAAAKSLRGRTHGGLLPKSSQAADSEVTQIVVSHYGVSPISLLVKTELTVMAKRTEQRGPAGLEDIQCTQPAAYDPIHNDSDAQS